mmetsp:Transcript_25833/g.103197  ORF Transcript_25833/g.103197 Transcript_25833/m.103197 type:complete len:229 (+) Transcript_25833:426-1112(+)
MRCQIAAVARARVVAERQEVELQGGRVEEADVAADGGAHGAEEERREEGALHGVEAIVDRRRGGHHEHPAHVDRRIILGVPRLVRADDDVLQRDDGDDGERLDREERADRRKHRGDDAAVSTRRVRIQRRERAHDLEGLEQRRRDDARRVEGVEDDGVAVLLERFDDARLLLRRQPRGPGLDVALELERNRGARDAARAHRARAEHVVARAERHRARHGARLDDAARQ